MPLMKSTPEEKADAIGKVIERGRANFIEAAKILDCKPNTIRARVDAGKLECVRVGGRDYITIPELIKHGGALPPSLARTAPKYIIDSNLDTFPGD